MTTYELYDLESANLIESFDDLAELRAALRTMPDLYGVGLAVRNDRGKTTWIDPNQSYYWTPEWQAGEREAVEDLAAGRTRRFETADDAIRWLQSDDE